MPTNLLVSQCLLNLSSPILLVLLIDSWPLNWKVNRYKSNDIGPHNQKTKKLRQKTGREGTRILQKYRIIKSWQKIQDSRVQVAPERESTMYASLPGYIPGPEGFISGSPFHHLRGRSSTWAILSGFVSYIQNRPDQDTIQPYFPLFPLTPYSALLVLLRKIFELLPRPARFIILLPVFSVILLILSHDSQTSPFPVQTP